jgi:large repetitive protein
MRIVSVAVCSMLAAVELLGQALTVTPSAVSFTAQEGGPAPVSQTITVSGLNGSLVEVVPSLGLISFLTASVGGSSVLTPYGQPVAIITVPAIITVGVIWPPQPADVLGYYGSIELYQFDPSTGDTSIGVDVPVSLSITPAAQTSQTITFGALSNVKLGAAPFTITATASSGLTVAFASTTPSVCTVSGNTVTIVAAGTCSITASQGGNAIYAAATPVTQSFICLGAVYSYYYVNQTIGGIGLTGYIVTDGTLGVLAQSNIIGYNLQLSDPTANPSTFSLSCCNFFPFDGSDLSATATELLFNFSGTDGGVVDIAAPSDAFAVCFSTFAFGAGPGLCEGAGETLTFTSGPAPIVQNIQFAGQSGTGVIGNTPSIISLPGGSSSSPVLLTAPVVGQVTGTIGGLGSECYYSFYWPSGAFSATASIAGASGGASYLFSEGVSIGGCNSATATLNSGDSFTSTIAITNLAPGSYCIGIDANNSNDPAFAITFNTPVDGAVITIANAASGAFGAIAPGELIAIKGANLGPSTSASFTVGAGNTLSNTLDGVQVLFDGIPGTPIYVSSNQVNAIVPYEIAGRAVTNVVVSYQGQPSATIPQSVANQAPGIFTLSATGAGQAAALNQDYTFNGPSIGLVENGMTINTMPAAANSFIVIYMTGGGQTDPASVTGTVTPGAANSPLYDIPLSNITATINGVNAPVIWAGAAPNNVTGVIQVDITVPSGVTGNALPLAVTINGVQSPAGSTVAVQ